MYVCSNVVILVVTGWPYRSVVDPEVYAMLSAVYVHKNTHTDTNTHTYIQQYVCMTVQVKTMQPSPN